MEKISTQHPKDSTARYLPWAALMIDVFLIIVFAGLGRSSHHLSLSGTLSTAAPFLCALGLAYALPWVHRQSLEPFPAGITVWLCTCLGGQLLRVLFGGTTQLSFILVSLAVIFVFTVGWRLLALLLFKKRKGSAQNSR